MIYLVNFLLPLTFLMLFSRYFKRIPDLLLFLTLLFLAVLPAMQNKVGTDYSSYSSFYFNPEALERYRSKGEVIFASIYGVIVAAELGPQMIFAVYSLLNTFVLFLTFRILQNLGFNAAIILFLFAFSTSFYFNQMNGIRQYAAGSVSVLCLLYSLRKQKRKALLAILYSIGNHLTGIINFFPFFASHFVIGRRLQLILFLISPVVYFIVLPTFITQIVNLVFPIYSHYLTSSYASGISILNVMVRMYDLPLLVLFWICYLSRTNVGNSPGDKVLNAGITIFSLTHFTYLASVKFGFFFRLDAFFMLYKIFPLYYLLNHLRGRNPYMAALAFLYISFPLFLKVLIFPSGEYLYKAIGF